MRDAATKNRQRLIKRTQAAMLAKTPHEKAVESVGMILASAFVIGLAWAMITLGWLLSPAQAECVEDAMNRPGRDGAYPTGCFVKPVPTESSNCISWSNIGPDKVCTNYRNDAADSYEELGPKLDQDEILTTPDGPCKRRNWQLYTGKCSKVEGTVSVPESDVFHEDGQPFKAHWQAAGRNICLRDLADLKYARDWYAQNHGENHGATQLYGYSLAIKEVYCKQFKVELTDFGPIVVE